MPCLFEEGGFGGKTHNQQAAEAARVAKLSGRPVQVAWTRAEEFFYDTFRPAAVVKIKAGVNSTGLLTLWDYGVYYAGGGHPTSMTSLITALWPMAEGGEEHLVLIRSEPVPGVPLAIIPTPLPENRI